MKSQHLYRYIMLRLLNHDRVVHQFDKIYNQLITSLGIKTSPLLHNIPMLQSLVQMQMNRTSFVLRGHILTYFLLIY